MRRFHFYSWVFIRRNFETTIPDFATGRADVQGIRVRELLVSNDGSDKASVANNDRDEDCHSAHNAPLNSATTVRFAFLFDNAIRSAMSKNVIVSKLDVSEIALLGVFDKFGSFIGHLD
jgi:hypothetical protein